MRPIRIIIALVTVCSLALSAGSVLPHAWMISRVILDHARTEETAAYRLAQLDAADYQAEIEIALDKDVELAISMADLARQHDVVLPRELVQRVDEAAAASALRLAEDAWDGFLHGSADSEAALGGAIAADLVGWGDLRDLNGEAAAFVAGEAVDEVTIVLASVGLVLTGVTIATIGAASPTKIGLSTIKLARRLGELPLKLVEDLTGLARRSIDDDALADLGRAAKNIDPNAMVAAAKRLVRPEALKTFSDLGNDVHAIGKHGGYRGVIDVLHGAESVAEVRHAARLSTRYNKGARAALTLTAKAAFKLGAFLLDVIGWLLSAALWLAGALWIIFRVAKWAGRPLWSRSLFRSRLPG